MLRDGIRNADCCFTCANIERVLLFEKGRCRIKKVPVENHEYCGPFFYVRAKEFKD